MDAYFWLAPIGVPSMDNRVIDSVWLDRRPPLPVLDGKANLVGTLAYIGFALGSERVPWVVAIGSVKHARLLKSRPELDLLPRTFDYNTGGGLVHIDGVVTGCHLGREPCWPGCRVDRRGGPDFL